MSLTVLNGCAILILKGDLGDVITGTKMVSEVLKFGSGTKMALYQTLVPDQKLTDTNVCDENLFF